MMSVVGTISGAWKVLYYAHPLHDLLENGVFTRITPMETKVGTRGSDGVALRAVC